MSSKQVGQTTEHNTQFDGSGPGSRKSGLSGETKTKGINRQPSGKGKGS